MDQLTPIHIVQQKCWDNDIYVRVIPTQRGYKKGGFPVTLNLEKAGRIVKYGTMPFNQNTEELNHKIEEIYRNEYQRFT